MLVCLFFLNIYSYNLINRYRFYELKYSTNHEYSGLLIIRSALMTLDQEEEEEEARSSSHGLLDRMDLLARSVLNVFGESQSSKHNVKTRCSKIFI